jgi:hypothetical protein
LSYAFTKEIRHKTILNIFDRYKIMINSPQVHLGITSSHAEVENKNLIIFSSKNHLDRFSLNTEQFIIKIYTATLCNFGTEARNDITYNIFKI